MLSFPILDISLLRLHLVINLLTMLLTSLLHFCFCLYIIYTLLLFCIVLRIVIVLPTVAIAIVSLFFNLKSDRYHYYERKTASSITIVIFGRALTIAITIKKEAKN